jgi:hypothetical protein
MKRNMKLLRSLPPRKGDGKDRHHSPLLLHHESSNVVVP